MAESKHRHHKHSHVPTVVVYGEFSPRDFQNLSAHPIEAAMKEFAKEEGLTASQAYTGDKTVVLFGTYAPKNTQSFRDNDNLSAEDVEGMVKTRLFDVDMRDIVMDVSVSVQCVPRAHGHYGEPKLEGGHYVGIDVFSMTSGSVFRELRQEFNYGQPTVLSRENGFHCNKRALNKHSPNAFIPYARLPDSVDLKSIEYRLHTSGCKHIREYSRVIFEVENDEAPEGEADEKEAFTELGRPISKQEYKI